MGKPGGEILLGWFGSQEKDIAVFGNGESLNLELKLTGFYTVGFAWPVEKIS